MGDSGKALWRWVWYLGLPALISAATIAVFVMLALSGDKRPGVPDDKIEDSSHLSPAPKNIERDLVTAQAQIKKLQADLAASDAERKDLEERKNALFEAFVSSRLGIGAKIHGPPRDDGKLPVCYALHGEDIPSDVCWTDENHRGRCAKGKAYCEYPREYGRLLVCPLWLLDRQDRREVRRGADGTSCMDSDVALINRFALIDVAEARADLVCASNGDPVCMITKESW